VTPPPAEDKKVVPAGSIILIEPLIYKH